ncbi:hypothetical protein CERZMDRAFT_90093 [Cercospora zeae-maydis SCOH1-5]|uniref:Uncharacterized protein n=1 Tax=Cercospora zeae-maydis SCOH1-5 TaxID=717836 RepID=A0A6A6FPH4_9PEZI|nr:hypothetical protein CERZMDRAFT_90093 [Cercospora zeae-maydis SCOH1-5]
MHHGIVRDQHVCPFLAALASVRARGMESCAGQGQAVGPVERPEGGSSRGVLSAIRSLPEAAAHVAGRELKDHRNALGADAIMVIIHGVGLAPTSKLYGQLTRADSSEALK